MEDIVARVPTLSFIDMCKVLVFARAGRTACRRRVRHLPLHLPSAERARVLLLARSQDRPLTRRSEWFVTKSPAVTIGTAQIDYMISFALPRFCDQQLSRSRKQVHYRRRAELDREARHDRARAVSHRSRAARHPPDGARRRHVLGELPRSAVLRRRRRDGEAVSRHEAGSAAPTTSCSTSFAELTERYGGVVGTTFRAFPSYPQRFTEVLDPQPRTAANWRLPRRAAEAAARRDAIHRRRHRRP